MAQIGTVVSEEVKAKFDVEARSRGTTSSRLAACLIEGFLTQQPNFDGQSRDQAIWGCSQVEGPEPGETKTEQVFVRMEPFYFNELGRLAQERLWYRGTYLANLFRAHLTGAPVLCDAEINAVRQVARQMADLGRNVNQIARKLNISPGHADLVRSIDFDLITMLIDLESEAVKRLMRANVRGWGVCDEGS